MTHRLVYVSRAVDPAHLRDILAVSRERNPARGVTGALCLVDGVFIQCLEGELEVLQDLYRKIARDPRHRDARLLSLEKVGKPYFKTWSLALLIWTDETRAIFEYFMPEADFDLYKIDPSKAATLLLALSKSSNWSAA